MLVFQYSAVDGKGQTIKNKIDATTSDEAIAKIRRLGYFPTHVKESKVRQKSGEIPNTPRKKRGEISISFGRVKSKELTVFTRQLSTLQDAGLPVIRGLKILN